MRVMGHLQLSEPSFGVTDERLNQSASADADTDVLHLSLVVFCHLAADVDAYATDSPVVHRCRVSPRWWFQPG